MIGLVVGNKEMIDGDGVVLPARLVEMSWLLSGLPSKSRFYRETDSSHYPAFCKIGIILRFVKSVVIASDKHLTEHQSSAVHVSEQTCLFWNVSRLTSKMLLISHQLVCKHTIKMWMIAYTLPLVATTVLHLW